MGKILDIYRNFRLVWRLLWDGRVPLLLKLAIPMSLSYIALPFDLLKDFIPVVGRIDDLIVLSIAMILFLRLAPPRIVKEHRQAIWGKHYHEGKSITEGEYKILDDDEQGKAR